MNCDTANELLIDALSGPVDPESERQLDEHLASCEACSTEAAELRQTWSDLGAVEAAPAPSGRMRVRFRAALGAYEAALERSWGRRADRWAGELAARLDALGPQMRLAAAAAVLVAGVGLGWGASQLLGAGAEAARLRAEMSTMSRAVTLALLDHQSASERLRGVSWSASSGAAGTAPDDAVLAALVEVARHDASVNVRLAAVEALAAHVERPQVRSGLLASLEDRPQPHLQLAVTRAFAAEKQPSGELERLLASDLLDPEVRRLLTEESGRI